jgi:hypothetical protein
MHHFLSIAVSIESAVIDKIDGNSDEVVEEVEG